jgi:4-hydroxy-3-methylbut-2-enyl diphosphate reductase IspH
LTLVCGGKNNQLAVGFGVDQLGLVWISWVWCGSVGFGVDQSVAISQLQSVSCNQSVAISWFGLDQSVAISQLQSVGLVWISQLQSVSCNQSVAISRFGVDQLVSSKPVSFLDV